MRLAIAAVLLGAVFLVLGLIAAFHHIPDWASYMVASNVWSAASLVLAKLEARP